MQLMGDKNIMLAYCLSLLDTKEDKIQFEYAYNEYKDVMFNFAFSILKDKHLAEDAVQEAFMSAAKHLKKFSEKSCIQMRNYLIIIVKNASLRIYNKRKHEICVEEVFEDVPDIHNIEIETENRSSQEALFKIIKSLDDKYSDVLILKYFYELKDREIAEALGVTRETVKIRIIRGKDLIKQKLLKDGFYG